MQIALPPELQSQMNRCEITIYYLLADMITRQAKKSPRGAMYAFPSQGWLAKKLEYSRSWVCKCMKHMDKIGVFLKIHRRKVKGQWRSCLYRFGWLFWKTMGEVKLAVGALLDRVKYTAHIVRTKDIKTNQNPVINQNPTTTNPKVEENLSRVRNFLKTLS